MTAPEREGTAVTPGTALTSTGTGASPADTGRAPRNERGPGLARSSGVMALGTIASRFTGFLRTAVLLYAIGTQSLGDAYNVANNLPNAVYSLALGGILHWRGRPSSGQRG